MFLCPLFCRWSRFSPRVVFELRRGGLLTGAATTLKRGCEVRNERSKQIRLLRLDFDSDENEIGSG